MQGDFQTSSFRIGKCVREDSNITLSRITTEIDSHNPHGLILDCQVDYFLGFYCGVLAVNRQNQESPHGVSVIGIVLFQYVQDSLHILFLGNTCFRQCSWSCPQFEVDHAI